MIYFLTGEDSQSEVLNPKILGSWAKKNMYGNIIRLTNKDFDSLRVRRTLACVA